MGCYLKSSSDLTYHEHSEHWCSTCANFLLAHDIEPCYSCMYRGGSWPISMTENIDQECAWTPANPSKDGE